MQFTGMGSYEVGGLELQKPGPRGCQFPYLYSYLFYVEHI